jgi:hypothetical protein
MAVRDERAKRQPRKGERYIRHSTEQTGDVQSLAICDDNFDPDAIRIAGDMRYHSIAGYHVKFTQQQDGFAFSVIRTKDKAELTLTDVTVRTDGVDLRTTILHPMEYEEAYLLADLEQCVALALAKEVSA